jgi:hypothetical protein
MLPMLNLCQTGLVYTEETMGNQMRIGLLKLIDNGVLPKQDVLN